MDHVGYLRGTMTNGLCYGGAGDELEVIKGFVDSDFAGGLDSRKSQAGYDFKVFRTDMSWKATLQPVVALSTVEAEFVAIMEVVKEVVRMKELFK